MQVFHFLISLRLPRIPLLRTRGCRRSLWCPRSLRHLLFAIPPCRWRRRWRRLLPTFLILWIPPTI
ncbi:hypothetical protein HanPSC8_Chr07g0306251 [Helianthus annuus]|nr:hypothetical protein HanPSC8_Chr07g0306251 [Helianthus annuus]